MAQDMPGARLAIHTKRVTPEKKPGPTVIVAMEPSKRMEMLSSDVSRKPFEDRREPFEDRREPFEDRREALSASDVASKAKSGIKDAAKVTGSGLKKATGWVGNILGKFGRYIKWICCILIVVCIGFIISKIVQLAKDAGAVATGIGSAVGAVSAVAASAVAMSRKPARTDDIVMPPPPSLSDTASTAPTAPIATASFEADAANANAIAPGKDMLAADMVSDAVAANNALVTDALAANNRLVAAALPQPDVVAVANTATDATNATDATDATDATA